MKAEKNPRMRLGRIAKPAAGLLCTVHAMLMLPFFVSAAAGQIPEAGGQPETPIAVEDPPELINLRETFEQQLQTRIEPGKQRYILKLKALEDERAKNSDYDGALRVQRKRVAVAGTTTTAGGETKVIGEINLDIARGRRSGSTLHYDSTREAMMGFERSGHSLTWDVMKVKPGLYRVLVTYGCADSSPVTVRNPTGRGAGRISKVPTGGSFTFEEATSLNTGEDRVLRHTVFPTGGWDKVVTRNIGRLRLTGTTSTLKFVALNPHRGGLMALRRIRLVPYDADTSAGGGGIGNPLEKLRSQYQEKVAELTGGEFEKYIADLKNLEERLAAADRIRDALAVKATRSEIERQATNGAAAVKALTGDGS